MAATLPRLLTSDDFGVWNGCGALGGLAVRVACCATHASHDSPFMGITVPLWAGLVQAALRLLPSSISGVVSNPQPFLFKVSVCVRARAWACLVAMRAELARGARKARGRRALTGHGVPRQPAKVARGRLMQAQAPRWRHMSEPGRRADDRVHVDEQAVLTDDYRVVPYVVAGTAAGSLAAFLAATTIQVLAARIFAKKPADPAHKAKAD